MRQSVYFVHLQCKYTISIWQSVKHDDICMIIKYLNTKDVMIKVAKFKIFMIEI